MNRILLTLFFLMVSPVFGQEPAHFILGEEELSGTHIYCMYQDANSDYWIASNDGIYRYDGYTFKRYSCDEMVSPSLFNVQSDLAGNIYCNNLSGQVFQIKNDTCRLYHQVPDSLLNTNTIIRFNGNDMVIFARNIYRLNSSGGIEIILRENDSTVRPYAISQPIMVNDTLHFICYEINLSHWEYYAIVKGKSILKGTYEIDKTERRNRYFTPDLFQQKLYLTDRDSGTVYQTIGTNRMEKKANISSPPLYRNSSYVAGNFLYVNDFTTGISILDSTFTRTHSPKKLFEGYQISYVLYDNEGNTLLGTFNKGIIVIPNTPTTDIRLGSFTGLTNLICKLPNNQLALSTSDGRTTSLDMIQKKQEPQSTIDNTRVEFLDYLHKIDLLLSGGKYLDIARNAYRQIQTGSIKDIADTPYDFYFIAEQNGVRPFFPEAPSFQKSKLEPSHPFYKLSLFARKCGRTYSISFDPIRDALYVGTATGLKYLTKDTIREIQVDGHDLLCNDIAQMGYYSYATNFDNGLLVLRDGKIADHWTVNNYLVSNNTGKLRIENGLIFVSTDKGIQALKPNGETQYLISKSDGIYTDRIMDFEVNGDTLWVLHPKGLQQVDLSEIKPNRFRPNIKIRSVKVNDLAINTYADLIFNHNQRKISFELASKSLKHRNEILFSYRLRGAETAWQQANYMDNIITYKALQPGSYEFQVKAIYRNQSSATLIYPFSIRPPFWTTWWFYLSIGLIILIITYIVLRNQLNKQRQKIELRNELNGSKLAAIQAQMNPHFIFNSLNSIQDLVLKNDAENAYGYISKFALLVRNTLRHSHQDFIDLQEELDALNLYLMLEQLRFKDSFTYQIKSDIPSSVQIPPMLIQPFIENALIHGLIHKEGTKTLSIVFTKEEAVKCIITDNGIGRQAARQINERQRMNHESFAVQAIKKRLEILEHHYGGIFDLQYEDLFVNGENAGTRVILTVPFLEKF